MLSALRRMRTLGLDARDCALALKIPSADVDRALWAMVGRTPEAAAEALGAQAEAVQAEARP